MKKEVEEASALTKLHGPQERQAGEEILLRSHHPALGQATRRLSSCPQLTSHDRRLDDASFSSGRQTEKRCSEAAIALPPVCRTLPRSEMGVSNFCVLAPRRKSKRSQILDLQKVYTHNFPPLILSSVTSQIHHFFCSLFQTTNDEIFSIHSN